MKKTPRFIMLVAAVICMFAISASAEVAIDYRFEAVPEAENVYDLVFSSTTNFPVAGSALRFTYDPEVFTPVRQDNNQTVETVSALTKSQIAVPVNYEFEGIDCPYKADPLLWDGNSVEIVLQQTEDEIAELYPYSTGLDYIRIRFKLVGKGSMKDVTSEDFNITMGYLTHYTDAANTYGFGEGNGAKTPVTPTITYYTEKIDKITAPAGSTVYFQDGTYKTYQAETEIDIDLNIPGYVVINTGYTAQKIYKVSGAAITSAPDNALLGSDYTEIRTKEPAGVRYKAVITDEAREETALAVKEYGFIATAETANLSKDYYLDMALVEEGKAIKGVAFDANTNKVFSYDAIAEATTFTAVVHGVDQTNAAQLTTVIAVRSYMITGNGKIVYGEVTKSTVYDTAKAVKAAGGSAYDENKEYIDNVIKTVETNAKDSVMDIGGLYQ